VAVEHVAVLPLVVAVEHVAVLPLVVAVVQVAVLQFLTAVELHLESIDESCSVKQIVDESHQNEHTDKAHHPYISSIFSIYIGSPSTLCMYVQKYTFHLQIYISTSS
jgi:hypothetical protein